MSDTFWQERLTATEQLIVKYETALCDLVEGKIFQYTLNTGQGTQTVTKTNIATLNNHLQILYDRYQAISCLFSFESLISNL